MKPFWKLLRVKHYVKNVLIFMPLFFAGKLFEWHNFMILLYMVLIFCMISSIVYIINDLNDVEKDRLHPLKCKRPIASGAVSKKAAKILAVFLIVLAVVMQLLAFLLGFFSIQAAVLLVLYLLINMFYSKGMKNVPILDVVILAAGYLIRIFYGACIVHVSVSEWLYLAVLAGAFYLGIGKRRNELKKQEKGNVREVLKHYNYDFLDKNMYVCVGLAIIFYALWAIRSPYVGMIWTVPMVMVIFMKYSLDIEMHEAEGNPMEVVMKDKAILALALLYGAVVFLLLYVL